MKEKLPKVFKRKWVAALRSGKYEQGYSSLYRGGAYCCLGVACVITGNDPKTVGFISKHINKNGRIPSLIIGDQEKTVPRQLSYFNDHGQSFKWIASYIEQYL